MPYIGTQPLTGQFKKLDAITVVNGQPDYTLNYNGAAYKPATANALLVSVNGVIQAAGDAYTISGSTITFTENLVTGDVIDFIIALGDTGSAVTPVDGSVTTAKLGDGSVTNAKIDTMAATKLTGTISNLRFPSGSIIQTQYTQFTGTNTVSGSAGADLVVSDLTVNITPVSTSSIIRIDAMVNGEWSNQAGAYDSVWFFFRDSTKLSHAAAGSRATGIMMGTGITYDLSDANSTPEHVTYSYFDSPSSTSQITYKVGFEQVTGYTWYLNRTVGDTDNGSYERGTSFISVTEIAG